jgi:hypothetical protein
MSGTQGSMTNMMQQYQQGRLERQYQSEYDQAAARQAPAGLNGLPMRAQAVPPAFSGGQMPTQMGPANPLPGSLPTQQDDIQPNRRF